MGFASAARLLCSAVLLHKTVGRTKTAPSNPIPIPAFPLKGKGKIEHGTAPAVQLRRPVANLATTPERLLHPHSPTSSIQQNSDRQSRAPTCSGRGLGGARNDAPQQFSGFDSGPGLRLHLRRFARRSGGL